VTDHSETEFRRTEAMLKIKVEEARNRGGFSVRLILEGKLAGPGVEDQPRLPVSYDYVRDVRCGRADMLWRASLPNRVDSIGE
jgi:hypothetical protein